MDIVYLSHCVPNPPDKGEKIRAHHEVTRLAERHRVHLACFGRQESELAAAQELKDRCASVYAELFHPARALAKAAVRFAAGGCLSTSYYGSRRMRRHVRTLEVEASVVYSSAMAQYAPPDVPMLLDMVDVDSEKWLQYSRVRRPGWAYRLEGGRLRAVEAAAAARSVCTFFSTGAETELFQRVMPEAEAQAMENGVDFGYFDRRAAVDTSALQGRRFVVFTGVMDYYPNADAACWFAESVFPAMRERDPGLEFLIVGRNPTSAVAKLAERPGITVTGSVPDVRPYLLAARAAVVPLRIARGIQNKVIEALAMGKPVYASDAACGTFGWDLPPGVFRCSTAKDYLTAIEGESADRITGEEIICAARRRFSWDINLAALSTELERLEERPALCGIGSC
jgi:polysaccharide biosynthesis protein PslH